MKKLYSFSIILFLIVITNILFISCSKDDVADVATPTGPHIDGPVEIYDNVKVIDSTQFNLNLTSALLTAGTYEFTAASGNLDVSSGDVIVGEQGEGFIRKVASISASGNVYTLTTAQGTMSDVFRKADFGFNINMDDMQGRTANTNGFNYTFPEIPLSENASLNLSIADGNINFDPNWQFDFSFLNGPVKFKMLAENANLNGSFKFTASAAASYTLNDVTTSILTRPYTKSFTFYVPTPIPAIRIPVKVITSVDLLLHRSLDASAQISRSVTFNSNSTFTLGMIYENASWSAPRSVNQKNSVIMGPRTGNANLNIKMGLTPKVTVKLYGVVGPHASLGLEEELNANLSIEDNWDLKADVWLKGLAGFQGAILGSSFNYQADPYETEKLSYSTPHSLQLTSGSNQTGTNGVQLPQPIKVRVLDNNGNPESNVKVYFQSVIGGGQLAQASAMTDSDGYAQTMWTLGNNGAEQQVDAFVKKADGTNIQNSPVHFYATGGEAGKWYVGTYTFVISPVASSCCTQGPLQNQSGPIYFYVYYTTGVRHVITYWKSISPDIPSGFGKNDHPISGETTSNYLIYPLLYYQTNSTVIGVPEYSIHLNVSSNCEEGVKIWHNVEWDDLGQNTNFSSQVAMFTPTQFNPDWGGYNHNYNAGINAPYQGVNMPATLTAVEQNTITTLINSPENRVQYWTF